MDNPKFNWTKFAELQQNLPNVTKTGKGNFGKYMTLDEINPKMLEVFNKYGFAWVTMPVIVDEKPCLQYMLIDTSSGEKIGGVMPLAIEKATSQGQGSAITYARRYAVTAITGLVADMDDDGAQASKREVPIDGLVVAKNNLQKALKAKGCNTVPQMQAEIHKVLGKTKVDTEVEANKVLEAIK